MGEVLRDIQCSDSVGQMAALGKFDQEFIVYGCAYRQNGETYYRISEHDETIYYFCEKSRLQGLYTTAVMSYTQRTGVPSGTKEDIWEESKWTLAQMMLEKYPDGYLDLINQLSNLPANNEAWPVLQMLKRRLEGRFERDKLQLFDRVVDYCFRAKLLYQENYKQLKEWLESNWHQMEDDVIIKDIYERTLYGIAYRQYGQIVYDYDARYTKIYQVQQRCIRQGILVTPIYSQTYWFDTFNKFSDIKAQYLEKLKQLLTPCLVLIEQIHQLLPFITPDQFEKIYQQAIQDYGEVAEELKAYGYQWNCIK